MMATVTIYKIRHKITGLFSSGGAHPRWTKKGKAWTNIGHIKTHFSMIGDAQLRAAYRDSEIVEYDVTEAGTSSMTELFDQILEAKDLKRKKAELARKNAEEARERNTLSHLLRKYPDAIRK
jgi:hypothetical protein